jgi:hypothetical protein
MEKTEAIEAFENMLKNKFTFFYQSADEAFLVENANSHTVKDFPYHVHHIYFSDIYYGLGS